MICIRVNGEERRVDAHTTLRELVRRATGDPDRAGVAVARNRSVVPRGNWAETELQEGDELEIVAPFQGG